MSIKKAGFLHPAKQQQQKEKTFNYVLIIVDFFSLSNIMMENNTRGYYICIEYMWAIL